MARQTFEQIVPFESQLETMGAYRRVVPVLVQPTKVTVHLLAPGVAGAEASVREKLLTLRHCGAFFTEPQSLSVRLQVGADGKVHGDDGEPEHDAVRAPHAARSRCVRGTFASMKVTGAIPDRAEIDLQIELAPAGPSYRDSH
jgi:hypothetical protein